MRGKGDEIQIAVENDLSPDEMVTFQSKKENPEEHGFGIGLIDEVVEKYHGKKEVLIDRRQNRIRVNISLKI